MINKKYFKMVQFEAKGDGFLQFLFGEAEEGAWALGDGNYYGIRLGAAGDGEKFKLYHDGDTKANEDASSWAQRLTPWKFTSYRIK